MTLSVTIKKCDIQHNVMQCVINAGCRYSERLYAEGRGASNWTAQIRESTGTHFFPGGDSLHVRFLMSKNFSFFV
jgi:hypothetical protein